MEIEILFAKAIKQKIHNYPRLDFEGFGVLGEKPWTTNIGESYWSFWFWVIKRFQKERLDNHCERGETPYITNKTVLVMWMPQKPGEYEFFQPNGELAQLYKEGRLDELLKQFSEEDANNH